MLNPNQRSLLTDALTPPTGMSFDCGLATTYSLDPNTLLTLPLHLALLASANDTEPLQDPIRLLESLRRVASRLTVFHETGRIAAPAGSNRLYSLLETMLHPCEAPYGGAFHPKVVLLRFADNDNDRPATLRLLVMSRNLTFDRSWDLSVRLEGVVGDQFNNHNVPITDLFDTARHCTSKALDTDRDKQYRQLLADVACCVWALPEGFDDYAFHVIGHNQQAWQLPASDRLAIISPFISDTALEQIRVSTGELALALGRQEELDALKPAARDLASTLWVLGEAAESSDLGEDDATELEGLHAKCYVLETGNHTRLLVGSANATIPVHAPGAPRRNVEFMVELFGPTSRVGGIEQLMGNSGLANVCEAFDPVDYSPDEAAIATERRLEAARKALCGADMQLCCAPAGDEWRTRLVGDASPLATFDDIAIRAWPLSLGPKQAVSVEVRDGGLQCPFGLLAAADITSLVGFELTLQDQSVRFGLELELHGAPEDRDAAILRAVIQNRDAFMRYLLMLLAEFSDSLPMQGLLAAFGASAEGREDSQPDMPMFEQMAKAFASDPANLDAVASVMAQIDDAGNSDVVPEDFRALWQVFEAACEREAKR